MNDRKLNLDLTVSETNLILEGLGQLPFVQVYALIGKIQEQARNQLNGHDVAPGDATPQLATPTVQDGSRDG